MDVFFNYSMQYLTQGEYKQLEPPTPRNFLHISFSASDNVFILSII